MNDKYSLDKISSLLFQCALKTRELYQKKNEINQHIRVFRAEIAEKEAYIGTSQKDMKKLDEDIFERKGTLESKKTLSKRLKVTNNLLLEYQQRLKENLEKTKAMYNDNLVQDEERIANYQKTFENHRDFYYKNPLAQKLLALQAEKKEIESRIKYFDDEITMAQKELDMLTGPAATSSPEKPSASISRMQPTTEPEEQPPPQTEENRDCDGQETAVDDVEENCEENKVQDSSTDNLVQEEEGFNDQRQTDLMESEEENQETKLEDQEPQSAQSDTEEAVKVEKMEEDASEDTEQAPPEGDTERPPAFPPIPFQETHPPTASATVKATPATPTFPFNFSPARTSDTKSPAFEFSLHSDPSTPGFPGFGLDVDSSQDEGPSFAFTSAFFNKKETTASKSSGCFEFPFGQPEQSQDFQLAFAAKSPQSTKKDNSGDDFPFSFNF